MPVVSERDVDSYTKFSGDVYKISQRDDGLFEVTVNGALVWVEESRRKAVDTMNAHFFYRLQTAQKFPA